MSNPTPTEQDEARRALATQIEASVFAFRLQGDNDMLITMSFANWQQVIAALRAPSLDRGAEEMRALPTSDFRQGRKVPRNVYHGDEPLFMAATDDLASELVQVLNAGAAAIRALPLPADLNDGGGK